ncbi:MAG: tetrahydrofolate dehydrogenase/cyclohydrolase catalytic domain-containing protein, partial [Gammaproteobacteria bacterium]
MTAQIINGKQIADELCSKLKKDVENLAINNRFIPGLAVLLVGSDPASVIYVQNKITKAKEVGINIFEHLIPETVSQRILKAKIENLNNDLRVHGILVQIPLPRPLDLNEVLDTIDPNK